MVRLNMKHSQFILGLIIVTLIGCTNLIDENQPDSLLEPMVFMADVEVPADNLVSKTQLGGDVSDVYRTILWEQGDEVYVSNGDNSSKFVSVTREKSSSTQLEGELSSGSLYYAAYPYDLVDSFKSSTFNIKLPSVQTYSKEGVSPGAFPMVAYSVDRDLKFKNICGLFVLQLTGKHSIASISFSGKDQNANKVTVAGIASVSMDYSDVPSIDLTNSSETDITLICDDPVQLLPGEATSFHFVLPESTFSSFSLLITAEDGSTMIVNSEKTLSIKRSTRTTASPLEYIPYSIDISNSVDLSANDQTANCYIVSEPGVYNFDAVKGNSSDYNGILWDVESVGVLWESFGSDKAPNKGDLIKAVTYDGNNIYFETSDDFREGNAVIAAKDCSGKILWSWHIWFTDVPSEQVYKNEAGIMMDRNLGATSAIPGDVGALGLFYQWGRKDPFLGSSSISSNITATSTIVWPESVNSSFECGSNAYAIEHPTTFITFNENNYDWYYSTDDARWRSSKSIYDPCPVGWRVPDGNREGVWDTAGFAGERDYDNSFEGIMFHNPISASSAWYPAAGYLNGNDGALSGVGWSGLFWSVSTNHVKAWAFGFNANGFVSSNDYYDRGSAHSVRCFKEFSDAPMPDLQNAIDLNDNGQAANCYIVSKSGTYKFDAVKGNSFESVGEVVSTEILWKSFGQYTVPSYEDLIVNTDYKDDEIYFRVPDNYREGNALIAAKDDNGNILWSWHIWLTDQPAECVYANGAGVMMDRNIGATSAMPGSICAIGLQYQWGRKDPFLGPCSLDDNTMAASTGIWSRVHVNSSVPVDWTIMNPMVYITTTDTHWNYQGVTLWDDKKTIYDPCPSGWRVPDGGLNGIWASSGLSKCEYDDINKGITIPEPYSVPASWYPRTLARNGIGESLSYAGYGTYWGLDGCAFMFNSTGFFNVSAYENKTVSMAVRCVKESSSIPAIDVSNEYTNLSTDGTANSYIVSKPGKYKFNATVKGNSTESVGSVETAEVLWESFGTDVTPSVGDIVRNVSYKDGYIEFETPSSFVEGNVVIAAKDVSGTILW